MNYEKIEKILKMAIALTLLMTVFSTGMNVAVIANSDVEGLSVWNPILRALLIIGPFLIAEIFGYRYCHKKAVEIAAQREKQEKERLKAERKARIEEKKAKQQPKKNKKK